MCIHQEIINWFLRHSVYVDDLNIIGNKQDIDEARNHLKMEFEMKDLGQTKFCLGLQLEHLPTGILIHQSAYIQKFWRNLIWINHIPSKRLWLSDLLT